MRYDLNYVYNCIEKPLVPILHTVQAHGIQVDLEELNNLEVYLWQECKRIQDKWQRVNLNSHPQMGEMLYENFRLPAKRTAKGNYVTDGDQLKYLMTVATGDAKEFIQDVLNYNLHRDTKKYCPMVRRVADTEGRLHPRINQIGASSGRMSVDDGLHQIPSRTELGRRVRRTFKASEGKVMMKADLSQIELRVMGALSGDTYWLDAYRDGKDLHTKTQGELEGRGISLPAGRRDAKDVNFGIIYGEEARGLAMKIGCSVKEAQSILDAMWSGIHDTAVYLAKGKLAIERLGYAETYFGRRRYIELAPERWRRTKQLREGANTYIQGTAADIFKLLTPVWYRVVKPYGYLLLPVHDEWVCEVEPGAVEEVAGAMKEAVRNLLPDFPCPLECEVKVGPNWVDTEEI